MLYVQLLKPNTRLINMKITSEMTDCAYKYAKQVFENKIQRSVAIDQIHQESGMNKGSASDYISYFNLMRTGKSFTRGMKPDDIEIYLQNIKKDYGLKGLDYAITSIKNSIDFWESQTNPPNIKRINELLNSI